jgi:hypothetical protein
MFSRKVPVILVRFYRQLNFIDRFSNNIQISNFKKIRPVEAELSHAEGKTDGGAERHDEAGSRFHKSANASKNH